MGHSTGRRLWIRRWAERVRQGMRRFGAAAWRVWPVERQPGWRQLYEEESVMRVTTVCRAEGPVIAHGNSLFFSVLGYEKEKVVGRPLDEFYDEESRRAMKGGGYERALRGEFQREERCLVTRSGERVQCLLRTVPMRDRMGRVIGTHGTFVDITESKLAEQRLRRQENRQRLILEHVNDVVYIVRGEEPLGGRVELVGGRVKEITGYDPEEFLAQPELWISSVHPEDRAALADRTLAIVRSGAPGRREYRFRHKTDGRWLPLEDQISPLYEADGRFSGMVGVARDVTEQREREERLALFSSLVHSAGEACAICDLEGRIEYVNPAFTAITGYTSEEAVGRRPSILSSGRHEEAFFRELWATIQGGRVFQAEFVNRRKNGELYYEEKIISPMFGPGGRITRYFALGRDVTHRKAAEQALRESESRLRDLWENANDAILTHDERGRILSLNRAGEACLGLGPEQWRSLNVFELLGSSYRATAEELAKGTLRLNGRRAQVYLVEGRRADGSKLALEMTVRVTEAEEGGARFEAIARDVTEQRALEAQVRQSSKMETVGRLAAGVAHDFNNLLTVVLGFARLAKDAPAGSPMARTYVNEVLEAGGRAAALTQQLLAFSRQQTLKPELIDLHAAIGALDGALRGLAGERVRVGFDLAAANAMVLVDPAQMERVLTNLVANARDAMPEGGAIRIATDNSTEAQELRLRVSDNGAGMDAGTLARVFDPFFTTKREGKGTGLGLSIVQGIVDQSGGRIRAASEPGRGTEFEIVLPCARRPAVESAAGAPPAPAEEKKGAAVRGEILLVEDEPGVGKYLEAVLAEAGHRVVRCGDGERALRLAAAPGAAFDLLLCDVRLPRMSGLEVARRARQVKPEQRVLFISGYMDSEDLAEIRRRGLEVVPKPITGDHLLARVAESLAGARTPEGRR